MFLTIWLYLKIHLTLALDREKRRLVHAGLATLYRGRLIPIMRGGDGRDEVFPELPADLAELTDDELAALATEFQAAARKIKERDEETLAALSEGADTDEAAATQIIAAMTSGVEALETIRAEQGARAAAEENFDANLDALAARLGDDTPDPDADPDPDPDGDPAPDAAPDPDPEPATASARPVRRPLPRATRRREPVTPDGAALVASTTVYPHADHGEILNRRRLAEVMSDMVNKGRMSRGQSVIVASAQYDIPPERRLDKNGPDNWTKIDGVTSPGVLTASGGLCAPLENVYTLPDFESAARPVRDALAGFQADRGGVNVPENPTLVDYADAVGIVTDEQDTQGGTYAFKDCMRIECPSFVETAVDSIYRCIEAGNLTARAYPELMARIDTLVTAQHARKAEGLLLHGIRAGSTAITQTNTASAGAFWEFFYQVAVAAAGLRSRHRMADGTQFRALLPEWIIDLLLVDFARTQFDRNKARGEIVEYLRRAGVNPSFYKDTPTTAAGVVDGTTQIIGVQNAGALNTFPASVQWAIYAEGSWLHLDSGTLNLGLVRDSTLNSTNDFQIFAETWEQVAFIGVESLWVTSDLCPNGTVSAPKDLSGVCFA